MPLRNSPPSLNWRLELRAHVSYISAGLFGGAAREGHHFALGLRAGAARGLLLSRLTNSKGSKRALAVAKLVVLGGEGFLSVWLVQKRTSLPAS